MLTPRWYQVEAVESCWRALCNGSKSPVIVAPCGSGKSILIAMLCRDAIQKYKGRVIVLAHRSELLNQNRAKIESVFPGVDCGVYSASLKSRETETDVAVCGIGSVYKRALEFGRRNLVIVDECHLISQEETTMYQKFFSDLSSVNPGLKIVGLTGTPYRLGSGSIVGKDKMFDTLCYSVPLRRLIDEGTLCPLVTCNADSSQDTSGLHMRGGEFIQNEMQNLFDCQEKIATACREIVARTAERKSVIIFCSGVAHADNVRNEIEKITGIECGLVTGETMQLERASILERFSTGELKYLCNVDVCSVGYDNPRIDAIAVLRATASPGWWAQAVGRGLRKHELKSDTLVLDFGQHTKRFGPLDSEEFGASATKKSRDSGEQDAPMKMCPGCREEVHAGVRVCECGFIFPKPELKHDETPDGESKILSEPEEFEVIQQTCNVHHKKSDPDGTPTLRINYYVRPINEDDQGNITEETISEWICFEHPPGFARSKAMEWWRARSDDPFPKSCEEAESLFDRWCVAQSRSIVARREGKWWRIISHVLDEIPDPSGIEVVADNSTDCGDEEMPF